MLSQIENFENEIQRNGGGKYTLHWAERKKDADRDSGGRVFVSLYLYQYLWTLSTALLLFLTDNKFRLLYSFLYPKALFIYFLLFFLQNQNWVYSQSMHLMINCIVSCCQWTFTINTQRYSVKRQFFFCLFFSIIQGKNNKMQYV